uniref:Uncharacterized protein n=1 Tax=Anguilla anguilla TaxID=7936 RepID=A0A0E9X4D9_ANGAN
MKQSRENFKLIGPPAECLYRFGTLRHYCIPHCLAFSKMCVTTAPEHYGSYPARQADCRHPMEAGYTLLRQP